MASPCSTNQIIVAGSSSTNPDPSSWPYSTDLNGIYTWNDGSNQFDSDVTPGLYLLLSGGKWQFIFGFPWVRTKDGISVSCPVGLTSSDLENPFSALVTLPTSILEYTPSQDPYAPWGGFSNWQRLRFLEYV